MENLGQRWRTMRFNPLRSLTPERLSAALDSWDAGWLRDAALIFESIARREAIVGGTLAKRASAVARRDWEIVIPDADDPRAEAHKETLEFFYDNLTATDATDLNVRSGMAGLVRQLMDAILQRYAVHEIVWQPGDRGLTAELRRVPVYFFENRSGRLRYTGPENRADGAPLDEDGWLITTAEGLGHALSILYMFRRLAVQDWVAYSEKFSIPGVLGRTSAKAGSPEAMAFDSAVDAFGSEWVATITGDDGSIPEPLKVISAANSAGMPQKDLAEYCDKMISSLVRGSDLGTLSQNDSVGATMQENETTILLEDDCALITENLQQLDKLVIKMVHGDEDPAAYIIINPPSTKDLAKDLAIDTGLAALGIAQDPQELAERYGRTAAEKKEEKEETAENRYNPDQPRGGKGTREGGQWVKAGASERAAKSRPARRGAMRPASAEEAKALKIPPGYANPMVSDDPDSEVLGEADKPDGSKFPVYTEAYRAEMDAAKWARIEALDGDYGDISARMDADIAAGGADADPALALRLIRQTGLRNGGEGQSLVPVTGPDGAPLRDADGKLIKEAITTYGASSLRREHVSVDGDDVTLRFPGKKGVSQDITFTDPVLAAACRERLAESAEGKLFDTSDKKTLGYLTKISGGKYKVHDFRTLLATRMADAEVARLTESGTRPQNEKELAAMMRQVAEPVSAVLGNTAPVALKNYIHPAVFDPFKP